MAISFSFSLSLNEGKETRMKQRRKQLYRKGEREKKKMRLHRMPERPQQSHTSASQLDIFAIPVDSGRRRDKEGRKEERTR